MEGSFRPGRESLYAQPGSSISSSHRVLYDAGPPSGERGEVPGEGQRNRPGQRERSAFLGDELPRLKQTGESPGVARERRFSLSQRRAAAFSIGSDGGSSGAF